MMRLAFKMANEEKLCFRTTSESSEFLLFSSYGL